MPKKEKDVLWQRSCGKHSELYCSDSGNADDVCGGGSPPRCACNKIGRYMMKMTVLKITMLAAVLALGLGTAAVAASETHTMYAASVSLEQGHGGHGGGHGGGRGGYGGNCGW